MNTNTNSVQTVDPVIERVTPYTSKIDLRNAGLRAQAASIVRGCPSNDKECQLNRIYRYVVDGYSYLSDPRSGEIIQTPTYTMGIKAGDCEDLSILTISLLENIGIKSYFVFTDDHAYSLACGINSSKLWTYIDESARELIREYWGGDQKNDYYSTFSLQPYESFYYGGNGQWFSGTNTQSMMIEYSIQSSRPVDIYMLPARDEFDSYGAGKGFNYFVGCAWKGIVGQRNFCGPVYRNGGMMIQNLNTQPSTITLNLTFTFEPSIYEAMKNQQILSYKLDGQECVVVDTSAGKYAYPGYDGNVTGQKIAVDPLTKEYQYLL